MPPFAGPQELPRRWDKPSEPPPKLLSRDFILLFCMAMFSNSYIAVFYCFEQWLESLSISPNWRGVPPSSPWFCSAVHWPACCCSSAAGYWPC